MSARDFHHDNVRNALIKDGWTITHDPLTLSLGGKRNLFADLGAERLLAAEKGVEKIAVEIKGFSGSSDMTELEKALGQYMLYKYILEDTEPDRELYLAVPGHVLSLFEEPIGRMLIRKKATQLIIFSPRDEEIVQWIK